MTPEPDQSYGTDTRELGALPRATPSALPASAHSDVHLLSEDLPEPWRLGAPGEAAPTRGSRASRAALHARARRLDAAADVHGAAAAWRDYARLCWSAGLDYAAALRAATRSLELVADGALNLELAEHLEQIGAHLACARALEAGAPEMSHELRRKLASLCCRAGDAETAAAHFSELARLNADATEPLAKIGVLSGWAPEQVSRERGVVAWHEAARRYKEHGEQLRAFEAIHRAFELDPGSLLTVEYLTRELNAIGRRDAADEVWRQSAVAAGDGARHDVRAVAALESGDIVAALAALLDGRADVTFDSAELSAGVEQLLSPRHGISRGFDALLAELGCAEWLAVRLEAGPLLERWTDEANCHLATARLEANYFERPDAAREALVRAIVAQPSQPEARARLSNLNVEWLTPDPLLRALVQSARAAQGGLVARQLAGEFAASALPDGENLRLWALERIQSTGHLTSELRAELESIRDVVIRRDAELAQLLAASRSASQRDRVRMLWILERRLALDPDRLVDHLGVVASLLELDPLDEAAQSLYVELLDVTARVVTSPIHDERVAVALELAPQILSDRGCVVTAKFHLRGGQIEHAISALMPLLEREPISVRGLLWLFTLARRFRDTFTSARVLERVASTFRPSLRGILEAIAAELYLEAHQPDESLRLLAAVPHTSQNLPRLVTLATRLSDYAEPHIESLNVEYALSRVLPTARLYYMLSLGHRSAGEPEIALAWLQRALSLRPADLDLRTQQLSLLLEVGDASRVIDALNELMQEPLPVFAWVEAAASALAWLTSLVPAQALLTAKRLLDHAGSSHRSLRAALLDAAQVNGDESFAIEVLERASAVAPDAPAIHLALAERRKKNHDLDAALFAAWRAASAGASMDSWREYARISPEAIDTPDAVLMRLELLRCALNRDESSDVRAQTLRSLAVARCELAEDVEGAVDAWCELAETGEGAWGSAVRDMGAALGSKAAAGRLRELVQRFEDPVMRARTLALAAQLLLEDHEVEPALGLLEQALAAAPESTCLLPLIERISREVDRAEWLDSQYATVEGSVLGVYGERSLHYRAARAFEQREYYSAALKHATSAFELRPGDVAAWDALVRISRLARQPQAMAHSAMRAVESAHDRGSTFQLLERAYRELGDDVDGLRLRFDLAIRMLVGAPQVRSLQLVSECVRTLTSIGIEEIEFIKMRFERALESLVPELEGPDGARLGIEIARASMSELSRFELACRALFSALKADADLEEFSSISSAILPRSSEARMALSSMLQQALDWAERPYTQLGHAAFQLLLRIAAVLIDGSSLQRLHSIASKRGYESECQLWESEELLAEISELDDARPQAIAIASSWQDSTKQEFALRVLERVASLFSNRFSSSVEHRPLDGTWQDWGAAYRRSLAELWSVVGVPELRQRLACLELSVPPAILAELRVELERWGQDRRALCSALAALAFVGSAAPAARAKLLLEAAEIAEELSDLEGALVYYRAAFTTQRSFAAARLKLGTLMVRMNRHRSIDQAQLLLEAATGLEFVVSEQDRATSTFLLAEALDALGRSEEACRILEQAELQQGPSPQLALLRAEHASRQGRLEDAVPLYERAFRGEWHWLRGTAEVSVRAARVAAATGKRELARQWLALAENEPEARAEALVLAAELQGADDAANATLVQIGSVSADDAALPFEPASSRPAPITPREPSGGVPLPTFPVQENQFFGESTAPDTEEEAWDLVRVAEPSAPALEKAIPTAVQHPAPSQLDAARFDSVAPPEPSAAAAVEPSELELAIAVGEAVKGDPDQLRAWLADGKRWLSRWPLSLPLAELVLKGVRLESHICHEHALEHVISVLRGDPQVRRPPELSEQPLHDDTVRSLLTRDLVTVEAEALALVWDGAEHEFLLEASDYEVTGVLRVSGTASPLSRIYSEVARRFGMTKTPLFYRRSNQPLETRILLLSPAGALLEGDLGTEERLIGYRVGCALWATLPEHSLLFGMSTERVLLVLRALNLAFGANEQPNATVGEALRLAQVLWQTVRSRSQRRLRELCSGPLEYERARFAANQVLRRAGLFVCGDLEVALHAAAADIGLDPNHLRERSWTEWCGDAPELIDLFRFACSAGYADTRWQSGRPTQVTGGARVP